MTNNHVYTAWRSIGRYPHTAPPASCDTPPSIAPANTRPLSSISPSPRAAHRLHRRKRLAVQGRTPRTAEVLLTTAILNIPIYTTAIPAWRQPHIYMIKTLPLPITNMPKYLPIYRPRRPKSWKQGGMVAPCQNT